jgi:hypothetical protein
MCLHIMVIVLIIVGKAFCNLGRTHFPVLLPVHSSSSLVRPVGSRTVSGIFEKREESL